MEKWLLKQAFGRRLRQLRNEYKPPGRVFSVRVKDVYELTGTRVKVPTIDKIEKFHRY